MIDRVRPKSTDTITTLALSAPLPSRSVLAARKPAIDETIDYDHAVAEGKQIVSEMKRIASAGRWRLGEIAHGVAKAYGEGRLNKFAQDIGDVACTMARSRSVYRAWTDDGKEAAPPISFTVAQELQAHPRRFELIKDKPHMTTREARRLARQESKKSTSAPDYRRQEDARWWRSMVVLAGKIQGQAGGFVDGTKADRLRQNLRAVVDATQLPDLREAGRVLIRLADYLERLVEEPEQSVEEPEQFAQAAE